MKHRYLVFMTLACVVGMVAGCKKQEDRGEARQPGAAVDDFQEEPPSPLYALYMLADNFIRDGDQAGATALFIEALDDPQYAEHKDELFTTVIRYLIETEQIPEAKTRFLNMIRTEPEIADAGFDLIYGHYVREGDKDETRAWVRELLLQPLTPDMKRTATEWLLVGLLESDEHDELLKEFATALEDFPVAESVQISRRLCSMALNSERYELLDNLLKAVNDSSRSADPALLSVAMEAELMSLAGRGEWDEVVKRFPETLDTLSDSSLRILFVSLSQAASRAKQFRTVDTLAETILKQVDDEKPGARAVAAREWVNVAMAEGNGSLVPARLASLLERKIPPRQVYDIMSRHFYDLSAQTDVLKDLVVQAEALRPLLEDDRAANSLNALMLDAAFILEDYDRALAALEKGVPDRDKAWHDMAITKIKAHKALQENNVDEAVDQFRKFMVVMASSGKDSADPASNIIHTRDMILGRNAKRIGDIYSSADRKGEARVAYAEARLFYNKALEDNTAGEETEKLIRAEMAEIPGD